MRLFIIVCLSWYFLTKQKNSSLSSATKNHQNKQKPSISSPSNKTFPTNIRYSSCIQKGPRLKSRDNF